MILLRNFFYGEKPSQSHVLKTAIAQVDSCEKECYTTNEPMSCSFAIEGLGISDRAAFREYAEFKYKPLKKLGVAMWYIDGALHSFTFIPTST